MKKMLMAGCILAALAPPAGAISNLNTTSADAINTDGNDIVYAEIDDNGDSVIYLKKDTRSSQSDDWSFYLHSLSAGDTRGVIKNGDPAVFYGFSPGPAQSVLYTHQLLDGVRSIYYATFSGDSALLISDANYPAYTASLQPYNFAFVKDGNSIFVAGMQADTAALSVPAIRVLDIEDTVGRVRYVRWSPDADNLVFMLEALTQDTAALYVLSGVQALARKIAGGDTSINTVIDSSVTRITTDTYYNTNPHFVGGSKFILYNRAIPSGSFKFANFSDTGGCTSIILAKTNWDAVLFDRGANLIFPVDTTMTTSVVGSAAHPRGYILLVGDSGDTDGDLSFAALVSGQNVTAASSGTFYFPANVWLELQAGAAPTAVFYAVPDTPKSRLRYDTILADLERVVAPVIVYASVPGDSMDKQKIKVVVSYLDVDMRGLVELSSVGLAHDTSTPNSWRSVASGLNRSENWVSLTPPHFSPFAIGAKTTFDVVLQGQSCLIERRTSNEKLLAAARELRDRLLASRPGRAAVKAYYGR